MSKSLQDLFSDKELIIEIKNEFLLDNKSTRLQKIEAFLDTVRMQSEEVSESDLIVLNTILTEAGNLVTMADIALVGMEYLTIISGGAIFTFSSIGSIIGILLTPIASMFEIISAYRQSEFR